MKIGFQIESTDPLERGCESAYRRLRDGDAPLGERELYSGTQRDTTGVVEESELPKIGLRVDLLCVLPVWSTWIGSGGGGDGARGGAAGARHGGRGGAVPPPCVGGRPRLHRPRARRVPPRPPQGGGQEAPRAANHSRGGLPRESAQEGGEREKGQEEEPQGRGAGGGGGGGRVRPPHTRTLTSSRPNVNTSGCCLLRPLLSKTSCLRSPRLARLKP
eukprot:1187592-Prorocentrum_minimum.AAC.3